MTDIADSDFMAIQYSSEPRLLTLTNAPVQARRAVETGVFQSIQALRGLAAMMVLLVHAGERLDPSGMLFRFGNAGVDIFFVISGFVMWTVTSRRPTSPSVFLRHRCVRLVPLYWIVTIAMVAGWAIAPTLFPRLHISLSHVLLSLAFVPHATIDGANMPVIGQGWTLNFEVFFYLLFAAALAMPARWRLATIAALLVSLPVLSRMLPAESIHAVMLFDPLLVEFLGGIAVAWLVARGSHPAIGACWGAVGVGIAALWLLPAPGFGDDWARLPLYGAPAFLIVGGLVGVEVRGGLRVARLAMLLGAASYSIYLTHTFAISIIGKLWSPSMPAWSFVGATVVSATLLGIACYYLLEKPLLGALRGRPRVWQAA